MKSRAPTFLILAVVGLIGASLILPADAPQESLLETTTSKPFPVSYAGEPTKPDFVALTLPDLDGKTLFEAKLLQRGLDPRVQIFFLGPENEAYEVRGNLFVLGDITSPTFKLYTMQGATETFAARISNTGATPNIRLWVNDTTGTPDPVSAHLEAPLRYTMKDGLIQSLVVVDPRADAPKEYMRIDKSSTGYELEVIDYRVPITAAAVTLEQPTPSRTELAFLTQGREVQRVSVDRSTDPATVRLTGEVEETRQGPIALKGDPKSPSRLALYADATPLLIYETANGKATLDVAGQRVLADATLLRIEGDPFTQSFDLVLRDASGAEYRAGVDRGLLLAHSGTLPIVEVLAPASALSEKPADGLQAVDGGNGVLLGAAQLDGTHHLAKQGRHTALLQTAAGETGFERILLNITIGAANREQAFTIAHGTDDVTLWRTQYEPTQFGTFSDNQMVTLGVSYEKRLSPLAVQRYTETTTYRYKLDGTPPTINLDAPTNANHFTFEVAWSGQDANGITGYDVQYRKEGQSTWNPWLSRTALRTHVFSGEWDRTYEFQARSYDPAGNPSTWASGTTIVPKQPSDSDDVNDPPNVRLLTPRAGDRLNGIVEIRWHAIDPDGTPVATTVQVSKDDGITWDPIYSGTEQSYNWDTRPLPDAATYRLRITASDGTLSSADASGAFTIANRATGSQSLPATGGGASPNGAPSTNGGGDAASPAAPGATNTAAADAPEAGPGNGALYAWGGGLVALIAIGAALALYFVRRSK